MDKNDYEKAILSEVSNFFNKDEKKIKEWYNTPHKFLSDPSQSPKALVDKGEGGYVLNWIRMVLN